MADVYEDEVSGNAVVLPYVTDPVTYTPTILGFGTPSALALEWFSLFTSTRISGRFTSGTPTAVQARLPLPAGQTVGTKGGSSLPFVVGSWERNRTTAAANDVKRGTIIATPGDTYLTFSSDDYVNTFNPAAPANGSQLVVATDVIIITGEVVVPIAELQALGGYRSYGAGRANSSRDGLSAPRKGQTALTVTGTGWTNTRSVGVYYQDQDGNHRLKFNLMGQATSGTRTTLVLTIAGVVTKNVAGAYQAVSPLVSTASTTVVSSAYLSPNANAIAIEHASALTVLYGASGDIELDSKPTWA